MASLSSVASRRRRGLSLSARRSRQAVSQLYSAVASIEPLETRALLSVVFAPPTSALLGRHEVPFAVITADINRDGIPDIITANEDGTIDVLVGNGNGTFRAPENFSDGLGSGGSDKYGPYLIVADINGDNDIFVANGSSSTVSILQSNSSGSFDSAQISVTSSPASHITSLAEATANGTAFLITGDNDGSVCVVPFNPPYYSQTYHRYYQGFSGFDTAALVSQNITYNSGNTTASFITSVSAADFNGDGTVDLLVVATNSKLSQGHAQIFQFSYTPYNSYYETPPSTTVNFGSPYSLDGVAGTNVFSVTPTNFNSVSTYGDFLVVENNGDVIPLIGSGDGLLVGPTVTGLSDNPSYVTVGDFNGDGVDDFLLSAYQNVNQAGGTSVTSQVFIGNGVGTFTAGPVLTAGSTPGAETAGNLSGDGLSDLVTTYYQNLQSSVGVLLDQTPASPMFIDSNAAATFSVGTHYSYYIGVRSFPNAEITLVGGKLPAGLHFKEGSIDAGVLSGIPTGPGGNYTLDFKATNNSGTATQVFVVTIDHIPKFTSPAAATFIAGQTSTFTIETTGGFPAPTFTMLTGTSVASLSATNNPVTSLTFTSNSNGTATLSGDPIAGDGGVYDATTGRIIEIQAVSGGFTATQIFKLTVEQAPVFSAGSVSDDLTIGTPMTPIALNGTDAGSTNPLPTLSLSGKLPAGLTFHDFHDGQGLISGTAATGTAGNYTVTLTAKNSVGTAKEVVTFTVDDDTPPKFTSAGSAVFVVGNSNVFTLSTKLPKGDTAAILSESGVLPSGLTFHAGANGAATITGKPAADTGGVYDLTITATGGVNDEDAVATQSFILTVREAPVITSANSDTFTVGTPGTFTFTTAGTSNPVPSLVLSGLPAGLGLKFTDYHNGTATLAGDPAAGVGGVYTLTLTASNLVGSTSTTFRLTVVT